MNKKDKRKGVKYKIEDSIEGWADALGVLAVLTLISLLKKNLNNTKISILFLTTVILRKGCSIIFWCRQGSWI